MRTLKEVAYRHGLFTPNKKPVQLYYLQLMKFRVTSIRESVDSKPRFDKYDEDSPLTAGLETQIEIKIGATII